MSRTSPQHASQAPSALSAVSALPALPDLSRGEALELGALIDVTDLARRHGFLVPVAVSRNLWDDLCALPEVSQRENSDRAVADRLGDLLFMARWAVAKEPLLHIREMEFSFKLPLAGAREGSSEDGSSSRVSEDYAVRLVSYPDTGEGCGEPVLPVLTLFRQGER